MRVLFARAFSAVHNKLVLLGLVCRQEQEVEHLVLKSFVNSYLSTICKSVPAQVHIRRMVFSPDTRTSHMSQA